MTGIRFATTAFVLAVSLASQAFAQQSTPAPQPPKPAATPQPAKPAAVVLSFRGSGSDIRER